MTIGKVWESMLHFIRYIVLHSSNNCPPIVLEVPRNFIKNFASTIFLFRIILRCYNCINFINRTLRSLPKFMIVEYTAKIRIIV